MGELFSGLLDPNVPVWVRGSTTRYKTWGENFYAGHWNRHKNEFAGRITNAAHYMDEAVLLASEQSSSATRIVGWKHGRGFDAVTQQPWDKVVLDIPTGEFVSRAVSGQRVGQFRTYFVPDGDPVEYITQRNPGFTTIKPDGVID